MRHRILLAFCILLVGTSHLSAQSRPNLEAINKVWQQFYKAFETLDSDIMAAIHTEDLIRVSGGQQIYDYQTYIDNYANQFKNAKASATTYHISLRFFERINSDNVASERGVYKLTENADKNNEQHYYGQFHVILRKQNGLWKISMDYDSTELGTIGEADYNKAHDITDIEPFINR